MVTKSSTKSKKDYKEKIADLKKELKEKEDKLLRSLADFQNYQKRMEKEIAMVREETKKKYLTEILDLYDLLRKAYEDTNPKEGLRLIISNIENLMQQENIKPIDCIGKKFDHALHHALSTVEKDECEDNIIIEEIKKGYMLNDKLLRPSYVVVAKKKVAE